MNEGQWVPTEEATEPLMCPNCLANIERCDHCMTPIEKGSVIICGQIGHYCSRACYENHGG